jgi:DNA-binding GntR family transcriptional regulator
MTLAHSAAPGCFRLAIADSVQGPCRAAKDETNGGKAMSLATDALRAPLSDAAIVERIVGAVMERKLKAGAKLPEATLCDAFRSSRSQIRRVLVVLAERGVVALHAHRGAFVARPGAVEAREVFAARRAIERAIVLSAADQLDPAALRRLRGNVRASAKAEAEDDRGASIGLTGQFHLTLAEAAGNSVLAKFLEVLVARTSLIIGLYGSTGLRSCSEAEHEALIDALAERDSDRAANLMESHLRHIEGELDIRQVAREPADIRRLFGA